MHHADRYAPLLPRAGSPNLELNPLSGELFVFINRKRTQMKILYFDAGGFCFWGKRLEQGTFAHSASASGVEALNFATLKCLIDGMDIKVIKQRVRYHPSR